MSNNKKENKVFVGMCAGAVALVLALEVGVTYKLVKDYKKSKDSTINHNSSQDLNIIDDGDYTLYSNEVPLIFDSNMEYKNGIYEKDDKLYAKEGTILKGKFTPDLDYYRIIGLCDNQLDNDSLSLSESDNICNLYIPHDKVAYLDRFKVYNVDGSSNHSYVRSTPSEEDDNVVCKLDINDYIYIDVNRSNLDDKEHNWHQVMVEDDGVINYGYLDLTNDTDKLDLSCAFSDDGTLIQLIYVIDDSGLYTKNELDNMYYEVLPKDGLLLYKDKEMNSNNSIYLPKGIVINSSDVPFEVDLSGKYYIKATAEIDNEVVEGYVVYRVGNKVLLDRTENESIYNNAVQLRK